jgi:hypothetical protein
MSDKIQTKLTVAVDTVIYDEVTRKLHQGQLSHIIRAFMQAFQENPNDIMYWAFGNEPLKLPKRNERNERRKE